MAAWGVLKPTHQSVRHSILTESDLLVEPGSVGLLLGKHLLGVVEDVELLLESFFSLERW